MRSMAIAALPDAHDDSRSPAQFVALALLIGGAALMLYGAVVGDLNPGTPQRTAFLVGASVAALGGALALIAPVLFAPGAGSTRRFLQVVVPVGLVAVLCPSVAVLAANGLDRSTSSQSSQSFSSPVVVQGDSSGAQSLVDQVNAGNEAEAAAPAAPGTTVVPVTSPDAVIANQITHTHEHGVAVPEVPLDKATRAELTQQITIARKVADQFPTVAQAEAAGYKMVTPYVPLIGAHYINWSLMDTTFDPAHPEMILYDGTNPDSKIVGLSYYVFSNGEPQGFAGPNDHWHQHIGLCINGSGVVVGDEQTTPDQCAARGGTKAYTTNGWMVHAWVVPGWESPQGVFSPEHPGLT
jgi:hypothetical protein